MPSTCCCVPGCSKRGGHLFPKDETMKKNWIHAIRRNSSIVKHEHWEPKAKSSIVCYAHFQNEDYISETTVGTQPLVRKLKKSAVPSIFFWNNTKEYTKNERAERLKSRTKELDMTRVSQTTCVEELIENTPCVGADEEIQETTICDSDIQNVNLTSLVTFTESSTQTKLWSSFSVERFMFNDADMLLYTGLSSYTDVMFVLSTLGEAAYNLKYLYSDVIQISVENQFFLTLMKLRQHKTNFELSRMFEISEFTVQNIWITWVNFVARQWKEVTVWPERDVVHYFSPSDFKRKFPTRVVIDGTECPVKKPKPPIAQQSTFSTYKNRNTIKILVGSTSGGLVSYVSPAYGEGSTSDRQIFERSYLTNICDPGDSIMADKGFNVQDIFAPYDIGINIPTFLKKKNRMTGKIVTKDRKISSKRFI